MIGFTATNDIVDLIDAAEAALAGVTVAGITVDEVTTTTNGTFIIHTNGGVVGLGTIAKVDDLFNAAADQAALETALDAFNDVFALVQERAEANIANETAFNTMNLVVRAENGDVDFQDLFNNRTATEADDFYIFAPAIMGGGKSITDFGEDGIDTIVFVGEYKFVELEDGATTNFDDGVGSAADLEIFFYVTSGGNTVLLVENQAFVGSLENKGNQMSEITLVDFDASAAIEAAFTDGGATILSSEVAVV